MDGESVERAIPQNMRSVIKTASTSCRACSLSCFVALLMCFIIVVQNLMSWMTELIAKKAILE